MTTIPASFYRRAVEAGVSGGRELKNGRIMSPKAAFEREHMSDLTDFSNYYEQVSRALVKANQLNKAAVFQALSRIGVTSISVEFDGEGDSGQIHNVTARAGEMHLELPSTPLTVYSRVGNAAEMSASETTLPDAIEMLCYDYLALEHGGWENNEGAFGEFHFDVARRSIRLDFNVRFTDVTSYSHEF